MNSLAWNCRGVGNSRTVQDLCGLVKSLHPKLVFLSETRMSASRVSNLRWRLGFRNCISVSSDGMSGGLALFWDESVTVSLLSQDSRYIDVLVKESQNDAPWRATFVYGEPRVERRREMWDVLRSLCGVWTGPWMVMGDFNEAMWQYEHFSETPRCERQMMDFREVLSHCDLHDLGFSGLPWTYNNNQGGRRNVRVRLDRGVANTEWSAMFPDASVEHITSPRSDHKTLLLKVAPGRLGQRSTQIFRYEIMWEREEGLGMVIEKAWQRRNPGSDLGAIAHALKEVTSDLKSWSKTNFGQVTKQIEQLRKELERLERNDPIHNRESIVETKSLMDEMLYIEEMMWLQRSRISWLKDGDRNTKYFHRKAIWRAKKNRIKKLKREDGSWCSEQASMQEMALDYFSSLFLEDVNVDPRDVVNLFDPVITDDMNLSLCKPYTPEEISNALFQIGPLKAPGPDGLPARFFPKELGAAT